MFLIFLLCRENVSAGSNLLLYWYLHDNYELVRNIGLFLLTYVLGWWVLLFMNFYLIIYVNRMPWLCQASGFLSTLSFFFSMLYWSHNILHSTPILVLKYYCPKIFKLGLSKTLNGENFFICLSFGYGRSEQNAWTPP